MVCVATMEVAPQNLYETLGSSTEDFSCKVQTLLPLHHHDSLLAGRTAGLVSLPCINITIADAERVAFLPPAQQSTCDARSQQDSTWWSYRAADSEQLALLLTIHSERFNAGEEKQLLQCDG